MCGCGCGCGGEERIPHEIYNSIFPKKKQKKSTYQATKLCGPFLNFTHIRNQNATENFLNLK